MSIRIRMALLIVLMIAMIPTVAMGGGGGGTDVARDTVGLYRSSGLWILRASNAQSCAGATIAQFVFGTSGDAPLSVDPDGDGLAQATVFRTSDGFGSFFVRANNTPGAQAATRINFGAPGDIPIAGNLDATDAGDEVGVYRPTNNRFYLNTDSGLVTFPFGAPGDVPIVGNWDGSVNGSEEVGLFRPSTGQFFHRADNLPGASGVTTRFLGGAGDTPLAGDWDADDNATIAVHRDTGGSGGVFYFNNMTSGGGVDSQLRFGAGDEAPVSGNWDGRSVDEDGC
ncbi:MAG: hypothetical protein CL908_12845 [Deltaproteobacteria bacterium]|nr:hypothetical protein [Deltaproteobacteria bacterium]